MDVVVRCIMDGMGALGVVTPQQGNHELFQEPMNTCGRLFIEVMLMRVLRLMRRRAGSRHLERLPLVTASFRWAARD